MRRVALRSGIGVGSAAWSRRGLAAGCCFAGVVGVVCAGVVGCAGGGRTPVSHGGSGVVGVVPPTRGPLAAGSDSRPRLAVGRSSVRWSMEQGGVALTAGEDGVVRAAAGAGPVVVRFEGDADLVSLAAVAGVMPGEGLAVGDGAWITTTGTAGVWSGDVPVWRGESAPEERRLTSAWLQAAWGASAARSAALVRHVENRVGGPGVVLLSPRAGLGQGAREATVRTWAGRVPAAGDRWSLVVLLEDPIGEGFFEAGRAVVPVWFVDGSAARGTADDGGATR